MKYLVKYFADTIEDKTIANCLNDILDTPISPELLPTNGKDIVQKLKTLLVHTNYTISLCTICSVMVVRQERYIVSLK